MLNSTIIQLKNFIKSKNTYFNEGIAEVYQDADAGLVDTNGVPVFPDDTRGNYFYFRLSDSLSFTQSNEAAISDCFPGFLASSNITLVAVVNNANPDILLNNLFSTIQLFGGAQRSITSAILRSQAVARQELSFMSADNLKAALQRIPQETTIVSINFTISNPVNLNECVNNPCVC